VKRAALAVGALALPAALWWAGRLSPAAQARTKLKTLEEVLRAGGDNDPRLDLDFKDLSPEAKRLFQLKYRSVPPERRNERGTIVYLLGMNLASAQDWAFLREVVGEPACLSLADCSKAGGGGAPGDEVTLAYPALVALRQAQRVLGQAQAGGAAENEAMSVIQAAKSSKMPAVARMVARIERR
jgi:hypothetical protein